MEEGVSLKSLVGAKDGMEDGFALLSMIVVLFETCTVPLNSKSVSSPNISSLVSFSSPVCVAESETPSISSTKSEEFAS